MPGGYTIDESRGLVLSRAWGEIAGADIVVHARALAADPRFVPSYRQLFDFSATTRADVSETAVWTLAEDSPFGAGARRAVVVASNVAYGLVRMFQSLREGRGESFLICRDMDEAIQWLDLGGQRDEVLAALAEIPNMLPGWRAQSIGRRPPAARE
jgi:hypothetical protein